MDDWQWTGNGTTFFLIYRQHWAMITKIERVDLIEPGGAPETIYSARLGRLKNSPEYEGVTLVDTDKQWHVATYSPTFEAAENWCKSRLGRANA